MSSYDNSVEQRILNNIIPTTKKWGIISAILAGLGLLVSGQIIMAILVPILYYSSVMAFLVLLEGYAEIIALLRKISLNKIVPVAAACEKDPGNAFKSPKATEAQPMDVSRLDPSRPKLSIPRSVISGADLSTSEKCIEILRRYDFTVTEPTPGQWCIASPVDSTTTYAYSADDLRRHIVALSAS